MEKSFVNLLKVSLLVSILLHDYFSTLHLPGNVPGNLPANKMLQHNVNWNSSLLPLSWNEICFSFKCYWQTEILWRGKHGLYTFYDVIMIFFPHNCNWYFTVMNCVTFLFQSLFKSCHATKDKYNWCICSYTFLRVCYAIFLLFCHFCDFLIHFFTTPTFNSLSNGYFVIICKFIATV